MADGDDVRVEVDLDELDDALGEVYSQLEDFKRLTSQAFEELGNLVESIREDLRG